MCDCLLWQTFYGGLNALIGEPTDEEVSKKTILDAIREEHTSLIHPDVSLEFCPGNYGITTTPQIEYKCLEPPTETEISLLIFTGVDSFTIPCVEL